MASLEELIVGLTEAVNRNTASIDTLVAGRDAALAQLEKVAAEPKPATRSRKKAESAEGNAAGSAEGGSTAESQAASPSSAPATPIVTDDALRAAATEYVGGAGDDQAERQARGKNIKAITDHFGTKTLVGETGIQEDDQRAQALFYLKRFEAGLKVDFGAEYDFAGDPGQGAEPAAADDDFDIG